jgi:DNA-binding transcriptional LysR family regulator
MPNKRRFRTDFSEPKLWHESPCFRHFRQIQQPVSFPAGRKSPVRSSYPTNRRCRCVSPEYFERNPRPQTPTDLDQHNCIVYRHIAGGGFFQWKLERDGKEVRTRVGGQLILDDPDLAASLMMAGAGLGLILEPKASPHLSTGRLVQVLDDWCIPFQGLHLYYPSKQVTPALRALIDVLRWKPSDPSRA